MSIESLCKESDDVGIRNFGRFVLGSGLAYFSVDWWASVASNPDHQTMWRYVAGTALTAVAARFLIGPMASLIRSGEGLYFNDGCLTDKPTLADRIFGKKIHIAGDSIPENKYVLLEGVRVTGTHKEPQLDYDSQTRMAAIPGCEPDNFPRGIHFTAEYRGQKFSGVYVDYNPPGPGDSVIMVGRYKKGRMSADLIARS